MSGIVVHRSYHAQEYVVVPNYIARDKRLSFLARGLLVMLLSLPPGWNVTTDQLAEDNPEGRAAVRRAMAELRDAGYVRVHREQGKRGRWQTRREVFDVPQPNATRPAFGATCEDMLFPQVAPNAGPPSATRVALKESTEPKYGPEKNGERASSAAPPGDAPQQVLAKTPRRNAREGAA